MRDDLWEYVIEHFGDRGAILMLAKTGDVKKGIHTVRVRRQHMGTAGRVENDQVAVDLVYATKSSLARVIFERTVSTGTPTAWAAGDKIYGADAKEVGRR